MTPPARISAAIEVLGEIETLKRPAADALKAWGLSHRFAGAKDRTAIASLIYDAQRKRASSAYLMGEETPRAVILGVLHWVRGLEAETVAALCTDVAHAPRPLTEEEWARLAKASLEGAPPWIAGDFPQWLEPFLNSAFGAETLAETQALATRAPVDLRVNTLKTTRAKVQARLAHLGAELTPYSPVGLRLPLAFDGRPPPLAAEPAYIKGLIEVQDQASQLAALLSLAKPGEQVLDLCAGAGGKSLALAALMQNKGQIHAADRDGARLMRSHPRLDRAGVRNVQLHPPHGRRPGLDALEGRCDLVFVDVPCTGSGVWRRNPDAKWRMRPGSLKLRVAEQIETIEAAHRFLKPGGRLLYVTCSVLKEENEDRIAEFLAAHREYASLSAREMAEKAGLPDLAGFASRHGFGLRLSPLKSGTDGFFIAMLIKDPQRKGWESSALGQAA
ncbi:MAG TPA: RsmB/NOP family class I SAM-dependent RNA methyltransferase [Methylocella sp.]|nr:RsmB/NOP family class I SAM-dependent RNA methyltransferase [Methylocella sp.]